MLTTLFFCLFTNQIFSQNFHEYNTPNGIISLEETNHKLVVKLNEGFTINDLQNEMANVESLLFNISEISYLRDDHFVVTLNESNPYHKELIQTFESVEFCNSFYRNDEDGDFEIGLSNRVICEIKKKYSENELIILLEQFGLEIIYGNRWFQNNTYLIRIKDNRINGIGLSQMLYETNLFIYVEPDFLLTFYPTTHVPNDTYFGDQWYLDNDGSNYPCTVSGGTSNASLDLTHAWDITKGDENIKIAIIDDGVELDHPDLDDNLLAGYDATGGGSNGAPTIASNGHGTACAGLAAAEGNNGLGIAGVCYDCSIIPVRGYISVPSSTYVSSTIDAIDWAWSETGGNADIISCCWRTAITINGIRRAIKYAHDNGRDGLGTIVVFSAGNDLDPLLIPYARSEYSISVSATNMCDELWYAETGNSAGTCTTPYTSPDSIYFNAGCYECSSCAVGNAGSNYGDSLDIVAPGTGIMTTDRQGLNGFTSSSYYDNFTGTSAATPLVAGIIGLMLTENAALTFNQVKKLLVSNTDQIGNVYDYHKRSAFPLAKWHYNFGYGRANAYKAVLATSLFEFSISVSAGGTTFCEGDSRTLSVEGGLEYQWYKNGKIIPDAMSSSLVVTESGDYEVVLYDEFGNVYLSENTAITVIEKPKVNAGSDQVFVGGGSTTLTGSATGSNTPFTYVWRNLDTNQPYPSNPAFVNITAVLHPIIFKLDVTNNYGCSGSDSITIITQSQCVGGFTVQSSYSAPAGTTYITSQNWEVTNTLTVPNGSILYLTSCHLIMQPCSEIIVEVGGELHIDGTTIEGCDGSTWSGISVYGDPASSDRSLSSPHGKLFMVTSTIKDADIAVLSGKIDGSGQFDNAYGGGQVDVSTTWFDKNNSCFVIAPYNFSHLAIFYDNIFDNTRLLDGCRDLDINSGSHIYVVYVEDAFDVTIQDNDIRHSYFQDYIGIGIFDSEGGFVYLNDNYFYGNIYKGIEINNSGNSGSIAIENNTFRYLDQYGVFIENSENINVGGNLFGDTYSGFSFPMYFTDCENTDLIDNHIRYSLIGLQFYQDLASPVSSSMSENLFIENLYGAVFSYIDNPLCVDAGNSSTNEIDMEIFCNRFYPGQYGIVGSGDIIDQYKYDPYWTIDVDPGNKFSSTSGTSINENWNILWGDGNLEYYADVNLGDKNQRCSKPTVYLDGFAYTYTNLQQIVHNYHHTCYSSLAPPPPTGIDEMKPNSDSMISVFPNPSSSILNVVVQNKKSFNTYNAVLYNMEGRNILELKIKSEISVIDTEEYRSGIYLLKLTNNDGNVITKRIIIEH
ncbi:MAG: S8 family serine peptidase [Bacteroidetes bacterium]|nr:S8 family serine peptidase [Bacteroidota bacterium]